MTDYKMNQNRRASTQHALAATRHGHGNMYQHERFDQLPPYPGPGVFTHVSLRDHAQTAPQNLSASQHVRPQPNTPWPPSQASRYLDETAQPSYPTSPTMSASGTSRSWQASREVSAYSQHDHQPLAVPNPHPRRTSSSSSSSSPSSSSSTPSLSEEQILSHALSFTTHIDVLLRHPTPLVQPIAIPQTSPGIGLPFLRAYAPSLVSHAITPSIFLAFIDNLNIVSTASPPLQILGLVGGIISAVPYHWAMIAGVAIQVTARLGVAVVSKGRTEMYMKEVNTQLFNPRGLKVRIASSLATRDLLRFPINKPLMVPLDDKTMNMSTAERVLDTLVPYNAVLDLDVPPPAAQTTALAKLCARQARKQEERGRAKILKERAKDIRKEDKRERKAERKEHKNERKEERKEKKRERKGKSTKMKRGSNNDDDSGNESDLDERRGWKRGGRAEGREVKKAAKLLWIVVENL